MSSAPDPVGTVTGHIDVPTGAPLSKVAMAHTTDANLGVHIANRLVEVGCTTAFAVPGKLIGMSFAFQPLRDRAGT